ncbi:MAG: hypothetical protein HY938_09850 [Nitrosomonadales bacterium]|nr:hypothetical protein [Nitrosomonadales bacterium]
MTISEEKRIQINRSKLTPLSAEKLKQLQEVELEAIARFSGALDELETAIGFLHIGFQFGWKPLALTHSKKTFRKYEEILGVDLKELLPETTPASDRHRGYSIAKKLSNFWKVVNGEEKIDHKREISPS